MLSLVMSGKSGVLLILITSAFIIATSAFIVAAIAVAVLLEGIASKDMDTQTDFFVNFGVAGMALGFLAFAIGLGASGFLYSTWLGVLSVVCSVVVLISFVWLTLRLSNIE